MLCPIPGRESLVHVCRPGTDQPQVYLHDLQASMIIDSKFTPIVFCPYCGIKVELDKRG